MEVGNNALGAIRMKKRGLTVAPDKSEVVLVVGKVKCRPVAFNITGETVCPKDYLPGVSFWTKDSTLSSTVDKKLNRQMA